MGVGYPWLITHTLTKIKKIRIKDNTNLQNLQIYKFYKNIINRKYFYFEFLRISRQSPCTELELNNWICPNRFFYTCTLIIVQLFIIFFLLPNRYQGSISLCLWFHPIINLVNTVPSWEVLYSFDFISWFFTVWHFFNASLNFCSICLNVGLRSGYLFKQSYHH